MFPRLLLLFMLTPLVELATLIYLGTVIGALYTILIVVGTGIVGASLAWNQGLATLSKIRSSLECGTIPSSELLHGALILAGGLLLLTPGVITDIIGFVLLIPQTRFLVVIWLRGMIRRRIQRGDIFYRELR
jgi:UPF0716 protein FxsA